MTLKKSLGEIYLALRWQRQNDAIPADADAYVLNGYVLN